LLVSRLLLVVAMIAFIGMELLSPRTGGEEGRRLFVPLVLMLLAGLSLLLLPRLARLPRPVLLNAPVGWFLAFLGWTAFSALFTAHPLDSVLHLTLTALALAVALGMGTLPVRTTAGLFIAVASGNFLLTWGALALGLPVVSDDPFVWRLQGFMLHEQRLALMAGTAALLGAGLLLEGGLTKRGRGLLWAAVALALLTLLATQARFFTAATAVMLAGLLAWANRNRAHRVLLVGLPLLVGGLVLLVANLDLFMRGEQDATLTNRIPIWLHTIEGIARRPLVGYGLGSFRFGFVELGSWVPAHAHNMYLNAAFEQGIPAALFLTLFLLAVVVNGLRLWRRTGRIPLAGLLAVYVLLCGTMGIPLGNRLGPVYGLMLLLAVQEVYQRRTLARGMAARGTAAPTPATGFPAALPTRAGDRPPHRPLATQWS